MTLNSAINYRSGGLHVDAIPVAEIAQAVGTPTYIYSLNRILQNYHRLQRAFATLDTYIHYSAKANANLAILHALIEAGAGIDTVSGGEIFKALKAGAQPERIVFAGVGKTTHEIQFALEQNVAWFNVENVAELDTINRLADGLGRSGVNIALRLNPDVAARTHPYIATGHGGAKFGLTAKTIADLLQRQSDYPNLHFAGIHAHIGSQLGDTQATRDAICKALDLIAPYPAIHTVNIGGGLPARYDCHESIPSFENFASAITPLLQDYTVLLEPGRSIVADAGILVTRLLYTKAQAGQRILITDASMTDLIRPPLYQARHQIVPVLETDTRRSLAQVVGPVCETADVLGHDIPLPDAQPGDLLAILTAGAYGSVMASNYNARPRPSEVLVEAAGETWRVIKPRETWDDLIRGETL